MGGSGNCSCSFSTMTVIRDTVPVVRNLQMRFRVERLKKENPSALQIAIVIWKHRIIQTDEIWLLWGASRLDAHLQKLNGLRKVNVTPWCDLEKLVANCNPNIIWSRKPPPKTLWFHFWCWWFQITPERSTWNRKRIFHWIYFPWYQPFDGPNGTETRWSLWNSKGGYQSSRREKIKSTGGW